MAGEILFLNQKDDLSYYLQEKIGSENKIDLKNTMFEK